MSIGIIKRGCIGPATFNNGANAIIHEGTHVIAKTFDRNCELSIPDRGIEANLAIDINC